MSWGRVTGEVLEHGKENEVEESSRDTQRASTLYPQLSEAKARRYVIPNSVVASHVPVPAAVVYTESANLFLHYIVALDLCRVAPKDFLLPDEQDERFVELRDLELVIHNGAIVSVEYRAHRGRGFRLPRIRLKNQE